MNSRQKDAEVISEILLKAASEPEFRKMLITDSTSVLEKYDLSTNAKYVIQKSIQDLT